MVRTWKHGCGPGHTRQPTRGTTERDAEMRCKWQFFWRRQRGPAPYTRRSAMHRSKSDIGGADAGAAGMSISSGSRGGSAMPSSLTPLPWPSPRGLQERVLARSVSRTTRQRRAARWPLQRPRGILRRSDRAIDATPCGHAMDATQLSMPCSRRRGP